ncbi:MAG: class I SAM-dependent DNA methyltransferase [Nitrospinae bacterium]|nr:class I SAM-dependent DNA methyltransferase [Nitrospinota bacterium]
MALSWNEIRDRAIKFSREWGEEISEDAEGKTFLNEFFNVFGVSRRRVATFETRVKKIDGKDGYIDLIWRGVLLIEQKSRGQDLNRAHEQAKGYFSGLKDRDLPRYIMVSDFAHIRLYDLETGEQNEFKIAELYKNIKLFGFMAGYQTQPLVPQDPANIRAAELMGLLHDKLLATGYNGHPLEVYLVRLLFLLFAEDTSIFEKRQFQDYIEQKTAEDGHDLGHHLTVLFHTLNTKEDARQTTLDEHLAAFPFVNGRLFEEIITPTSFNAEMRQALLDLCALDWSRISPAIFGSLFQSVMDPKARRDLGAHYTSEQNILKLIKPLFLDALWREFEKVKSQKKRLIDFHKKLAGFKFFDPACGCGNFLVIAYRELRLLELEVLRVLHGDRFHGFLDVSPHIWMDVDQFYGIEIEEFPAQIAQVALWMTDHQMNMRVSEEFGQYFRRLPLDKSPNIAHGNALRLDWKEIVEPKRLSYILGNPPFGGAKFLGDRQKEEVAVVFGNARNSGLLDYVTCWYRKAAEYMAKNPAIRTAFVSTNSITQGEQAGVLWPELFNRGIKINFAHRTFQWSNEGRGKAAVHCVIIGFALEDEAEKRIFDYETPKSEPHAVEAVRINQYLVDGESVTLMNREKPICDSPEIGIGNKPIDGGHYLFAPEEKAEFIKKEPASKKWFRRWIGAEEFLNGYDRWCLWLGDCPPEELRKMPETLKQVESVKRFRLASKSAPTQKLAKSPTRFHVENMPKRTYLVIPKTSSERRDYIPIGFMKPSVISGDANFIIPNAKLYHFGVLTSMMHMAWVRSVCGRLKSDYRYSANLVYNNFPWPEPTEKQRKAIESAAQGVLDARAKHTDATLADLYDPLTMPPQLLRAHQKLDQAVDAAYGKTKFTGEAARVSFLFQLYGQIVAPLINGTRHS